MNWFSTKRAYLDWAAAAPASPRAVRAYTQASKAYGNPSSPHTEGREARRILEDARTRIARELEAKPDDVIFTSGATEANNMAILGHIYALMNAGRKPESIHALYLASAHASVVETMRVLAHLGVAIEVMPIRGEEVDIKRLMGMLRPETALISMDFVCGETGTVWNTRDVRHALPPHVRLHVDATQAPYEESCERMRVGADMLVLDAQKIGGVRGMGVLVAPRTVPLSAIIMGGGQERSLRSGTPSPAHAAAFAAALTEAGEARKEFATRARRMREAFLSDIKSIPGLEVNEGKKNVAHIVNLSLIGRDTDYLVALLDEAGFAVSTKSACESDSAAGSRAVLALTGDTARAASTLRVSWGPATPKRELINIAAALRKAVAFLDSHPS